MLIDTTQVKDYLQCPRKYYYRHILGYVNKVANHDLWFGISVHRYFEYIHDNLIRTTRRFDPSEKLLEEAYEVFVCTYREQYTADMDEIFYPKEPANARRILNDYWACATWLRDWQITYSEIAGKLEAKDFTLAFRIDSILTDPTTGEMVVREIKSSAMDPHSWERQFSFDLQVMSYSTVLRSLSDGRYDRVIVDGVFFHAPPRVKKDGSIYAQDMGKKANHIVIVVPTSQQLLDWYNTMKIVHRRINDGRALEGEKQLRYFHQCQGFQCGGRRPCPYYELCYNTNGLLSPEEFNQWGYVYDVWDPTNVSKPITVRVEDSENVY